MRIARFFACSLWCVAAYASAASVAVSDIWVRGTVAGQTTTGAYLNLSSQVDSALLGASSPVAGLVEVHEMHTEGGVMKMRSVQSVPLPAGETVSLSPSGHYHVMLMELTKPLFKGQLVRLNLRIRRHDGKIETLHLEAPVRDITATGNDAPAAAQPQ